MVMGRKSFCESQNSPSEKSMAAPAEAAAEAGLPAATETPVNTVIRSFVKRSSCSITTRHWAAMERCSPKASSRIAVAPASWGRRFGSVRPEVLEKLSSSDSSRQTAAIRNAGRTDCCSPSRSSCRPLLQREPAVFRGSAPVIGVSSSSSRASWGSACRRALPSSAALTGTASAANSKSSSSAALRRPAPR